MAEPCVFCMILDGTIPSIRIHEDDATLAFMDIHPVQPGHALVIPKAHHANLFEAPPEVVAAKQLLRRARVSRAQHGNAGCKRFVDHHPPTVAQCRKYEQIGRSEQPGDLAW